MLSRLNPVGVQVTAAAWVGIATAASASVPSDIASFVAPIFRAESIPTIRMTPSPGNCRSYLGSAALTVCICRVAQFSVKPRFRPIGTRADAFPDDGSTERGRSRHGFSATVLGFFWSATMKTTIFVRWSWLGLRDTECTAPGGS